jgi:hypothetical protein
MKAKRKPNSIPAATKTKRASNHQFEPSKLQTLTNTPRKTAQRRAGLPIGKPGKSGRDRGEIGADVSVAHETRILAEGLGLARIVRSRNVSLVLWQSRQCSIGLVILASSQLSRRRSGCYGAAAVLWGSGGIARDLKGLQGVARGC